MDKDSYKYQLNIEEYKTLRQEILDRIKNQTQLEIFSFTVSGVIWSGILIGKGYSLAPWLGICIGLLILGSAFLSTYESKFIFKIGAYIAAKFETDEIYNLQWETLSYQMNNSDELKWSSIVNMFLSLNRHSLYYIILTIVNMFLITFITLQV